MNPSKAIGLGEPEVVGKKSLFQPPKSDQEQKPVIPKKIPPTVERRVRMTLEMTMSALSIVQEAQSRFRLDTGHPLPMWKIIGDALELYGKMQKGDGNEKP